MNTNINGAKEEGKKYRLAENEKFTLEKIDNVFMVMFPLLFSVFNIVYWTVLTFCRPLWATMAKNNQFELFNEVLKRAFS